jgi:RNA-directed DNA polymerase
MASESYSVKAIGKLCEGKPHAQFDEGALETGRWCELYGHEIGNDGHRQVHTYILPRQCSTLLVVTGSTKEVLENKIKPAIEAFLNERGLELSQEKTKITHIDDGFDFLGFNIRKYSGKLLIKPAKRNVLSFLRDLRVLINENKAAKTEVLIRKLNARIRGWANYYCHAISSRIFSYVDHTVFQAISKWIKRRHPEKNAGWRHNKYFRRLNLRNWIFFAKIQNKKGVKSNLDLFLASSVKIKRHIKIRSDANPFDPTYTDYFEKRNKRNKISSRDVGPEERYLPIF